MRSRLILNVETEDDTKSCQIGDAVTVPQVGMKFIYYDEINDERLEGTVVSLLDYTVELRGKDMPLHDRGWTTWVTVVIKDTSLD